jgi:hypothetical protein
MCVCWRKNCTCRAGAGIMTRWDVCVCVCVKKWQGGGDVCVCMCVCVCECVCACVCSCVGRVHAEECEEGVGGWCAERNAQAAGGVQWWIGGHYRASFTTRAGGSGGIGVGVGMGARGGGRRVPQHNAQASERDAPVPRLAGLEVRRPHPHAFGQPAGQRQQVAARVGTGEIVPTVHLTSPPPTSHNGTNKLHGTTQVASWPRAVRGGIMTPHSECTA